MRVKTGNERFLALGFSSIYTALIVKHSQARFRRRPTHVPNLTDELSTAKERRVNQFGMAVLVW